MANTTVTKRNKSILPDLKNYPKKSLDPIPQKDELNRAKVSKNLKPSKDYLSVRGHIVPRCSQINIKSSDSEKLSEDDLTRRRNSKLKSMMKLEPVTEKGLLMERFESSLKERLLSSAHFSKQVPLFDSMQNKDKVRMKTPLGMDHLTKNESMFNAVFPARKESGKFVSPRVNEELFSKHNRESQDWLKEIENEVQKDEANKDEQKKNHSKHENNLQKISYLSRKIKRDIVKNKSEKPIQNELDNGSLEQLKFLSSPRLSSKVGERGSSRSKIAIDKYSSLESNIQNSQKLILPKLSSQNISREASKSVILENQRAMESDSMRKLESKISSFQEPIVKSDGVNTDQGLDEISDKTGSKVNINLPESLPNECSLKERKNVSKSCSNDFNNGFGNDKEEWFVGKEESVEVCGQEAGGSTHTGQMTSSSTEESQNTNLGREKSLAFSNKGLRPDGPLGREDSLIRYDEYNVMYFETARESEQKLEDETTDELTVETTEISIEGLRKGLSNVTVAEYQAAERKKQENKFDEMEEEESPKEIKEEEDCTVEPCHEPSWFEEYGIDKKSRKGMEEQVKSEESLEDDYEVELVDEKEDIVKQVVPDENLEAKKRKVRKAQTTEIKEFEEIQDVIEEPAEMTFAAVRKIKTVPLVTVDQIPEKERVTVEKPMSQMPMEYLKKYVGKHLVAGLAQVALVMPKDPIDYLAHWLIKERNKENLLEEFKEFKAEVRQLRKNSIDEMRRKLQMDYLQNEALKRYHEGKFDPLYPIIDSSESETDIRSIDEITKLKEEEEMLGKMTEQEEMDQL